MNPETQFFWLTPSLLPSHYTDDELFSHIRSLKVTNKLGREITFRCQHPAARVDVLKAIYATDAVDYPSESLWIGHLFFVLHSADRCKNPHGRHEQDLWRLRFERGGEHYTCTNGRMAKDVMEWTLWYLQRRKDPPTGYTIFVEWTNDVL